MNTLNGSGGSDKLFGLLVWFGLVWLGWVGFGWFVVVVVVVVVDLVGKAQKYATIYRTAESRHVPCSLLQWKRQGYKKALQLSNEKQTSWLEYNIIYL